MRKFVSAIMASVIVLFACGPSTPGSETLCGPAPNTTECPNPKCVCFLAQCGWKCNGWEDATPDDQLTPNNGWSVSPDGVWTQNDAGVSQ